MGISRFRRSVDLTRDASSFSVRRDRQILFLVGEKTTPHQPVAKGTCVQQTAAGSAVTVRDNPKLRMWCRRCMGCFSIYNKVIIKEASQSIAWLVPMVLTDLVLEHSRERGPYIIYLADAPMEIRMHRSWSWSTCPWCLLAYRVCVGQGLHYRRYNIYQWAPVTIISWKSVKNRQNRLVKRPKFKKMKFNNLLSIIDANWTIYRFAYWKYILAVEKK
jgi:hypothetical protein